MEIKELTPQEFETHQLEYDNANFVQSRQMYDVHRQRGTYDDAFLIGFFKEQRLVGQAVVLVRRRMRFFKEAVLFQGPLFNERDVHHLPEMLAALEVYLRGKGIARVEMTPYLMDIVMTVNLDVIEEHRYQSVVEAYEQLGYQRVLDYDSGVTIQQIFRKPVSEFEDSEVIYQELPQSTKLVLKKAEESQVFLKELPLEDLDVFYRILNESAHRKNFTIQNREYFQLLKESFGSDLKVMVAFLDVTAYSVICDERIRELELRLEELHQRRPSTKTQGLITETMNQLRAAQRRRSLIENMEASVKYVPLSGYLFIAYGTEVTSVFAGNYEEYMSFGGATLLNWKMLEYTKDNQYDYYNFYGTMEVNDAKKGDGNFHFKRQFGGQLERMVGIFSKNISPILKLMMTIKSGIR